MSFSPWGPNTLFFLCQAVWQSTFLLLFVLVMLRWLRRPSDRAAVADTSLVLILLGPLVASLLPHYVLRPGHYFEFLPLVEPGSYRLIADWSGWAGACATAVLFLWLAVTALHLGRLCFGAWLLQQSIRDSMPHESLRIQRIVTRIDRSIDIHVRVVPGLIAPSCWQFRRSFLLLPDFVLHLPDDDLELILRHEIAHIRFAHPVRVLLSRLAIAFYWFHPLVYVLSRRATLCRELACDDWAARTTASRRHYAKTLVGIAERTVRTRNSTLELAFQGAASDLPARVLRLMENHQAIFPSNRQRATAWFALTGSCLLMLALSVGRITGDITTRDGNHWTPWPRITADILDVLGVEVLDYDPYRFHFEPRERRPEHRKAHRMTVSHSSIQHSSLPPKRNANKASSLRTS